LLALRVIWPDGYSRRTRADGNDPAGKRGDQDGERPWRDPLRRGPGFRPVLLCITRGPTDAGTDSDLAAQLADRYHGRQLRPARLAQRSRAIPRTFRSRCTRGTRGDSRLGRRRARVNGNRGGGTIGLELSASRPEASGEQFARRATVALAERLGTEVTNLPAPMAAGVGPAGVRGPGSSSDSATEQRERCWP
jgi:hypothetical protein